jgi:hypothetical protein
MRPPPPLHPWVTRLLFLAGGYVLRWWIADDQSGGAADDVDAPRRRRSRRRVPPPEEELKLVLVVNEGLKMGKGKIGEERTPQLHARKKSAVHAVKSR